MIDVSLNYFVFLVSFFITDIFQSYKKKFQNPVVLFLHSGVQGSPGRVQTDGSAFESLSCTFSLHSGSCLFPSSNESRVVPSPSFEGHLGGEVLKDRCRPVSTSGGRNGGRLPHISFR